MSDRRQRSYWRVVHLAVALGIMIAPAAVGEQPDRAMVGKQVVQKTLEFTLKVDPGGVETYPTSVSIYRVERVDGPRLWLRSDTLTGWSEAAKVVTVDNAMDHFTDCIRDQPDDPFGYTMRAIIWSEVRKELDPALDDLDAAIRISPGFGLFHIYRGIIRQRKKDYDGAIADFTEVIRIDPNEAGAFSNRGNVWRFKKQYDKAIIDFDAAIRLNPTLTIAYVGRGHAWRYKREYEKALADFTEAIRIDPKTALAFCGRGLVWMEKKQYDKVIVECDAAIRVNPKYIWPQHCRAIVMLLTGRDGAEGEVRKTIGIDGWRGKHTPYAVVIGYFGARRAKHDDAAKALLDDAAKQCDTSAWPYPVVRFLRREIDDRRLALADDDDKRTEVHCYLGLDHAFAGRADKARYHYRWVVVHGAPNNVEYTITLAELDRLDAGVKH